MFNVVTDDQEERLSEAARAEENPNEKENLKDGQKKKQLDGEYRLLFMFYFLSIFKIN